MTDYAELKAKAEAAKEDMQGYYEEPDWRSMSAAAASYYRTAAPDVILALLAENERLRENLEITRQQRNELGETQTMVIAENERLRTTLEQVATEGHAVFYSSRDGYATTHQCWALMQRLAVMHEAALQEGEPA